MKNLQIFSICLIGLILSIIFVKAQIQALNPEGLNYLEGYEIRKSVIRFIYKEETSVGKVYVVGNFTGWKKHYLDWEMRYNRAESYWMLEVPISRLKQKGESFYEFTFLVNGEYIDANPFADNVIHCGEHGYRYVIEGV